MLTKALRDTADKIDAGSCEMTEEEAMDLMGVLSHQAMSKEDACIYLNVGGSRLGELVRKGEIPKGRKRRGFKELRWYKDELDPYLRKRKKK